MLLKQKSRQGFDYLYKQYSGALYGIIRKVIADEQTAQDVLQEAFVKIWNNIDKFDPAKGRLYTWMLNLCRNTAIDKLRSKGEIMKGKIRTGDDIVYNEQNDLSTEQKTDTIGLRNVVAGMKPEYQSIVELAYFKGFTLDEISKSLDVPLGTVKTRMRKAMSILREHYNIN
ncbi:MAG: sigma-70 family RNA polymerase sigma factor [Chitinophagales bacterium]|nr:sigma-70 family RNA polymerase sigma factor [Chitinophagales bacterium]